MKPFDKNIICWGDSLTFGFGSTAGNDYPSRLAALSGYTTSNQGVSGQTSTQIEARVVADTAHFGTAAILWMGRNDTPTNFASVMSNIAASVAVLTTNRYLVLSVTNAATETIGTSVYNQIIALNAQMASTYKEHYLDVRSYLVSQYDPNQAQDVIDHSNDIMPTSLRFDGTHLNDSGYAKLASYIFTRITQLTGLTALGIGL